MNSRKTKKMLLLTSVLVAQLAFGQMANSEHQKIPGGEGLFRPSESAAPLPVMEALSGVVRVASRIQFRLTVFATSEQAAAARSKPGARDKEYMASGGVIWPVMTDRPGLDGLCTDPAQAAQPGFFELCKANSSIHGTLPQTILTDVVHGSASGFVVGRLHNGDYIVATAYHVAREAIERAHRTAGVEVFRGEAAPDLVVGVSKDGQHRTNDYLSVQRVELLANASEEEWKHGEDWALLAIPSKGISQLRVLPIADLVPLAGTRVWVLGFPTRTRRELSSKPVYENANDDLRISSGTIVGDAEARKVSAASDLLSTADGVAGNSGSAVLNDEGEVVGLFRDHTAKEDEIDLRIARYQGLAQIVPVQFFDSLLLRSPQTAANGLGSVLPQ
jgi:S1-C subfamily serine protease